MQVERERERERGMFVIQTIHAKTRGNRRSMPLRARETPKELSVATTTQKEWGGYRKQHIFAVSPESFPAPWKTNSCVLQACRRNEGEKKMTASQSSRPPAFHMLDLSLIPDDEYTPQTTAAAWLARVGCLVLSPSL
jgi:hypothetical protein